MHYRTIFRLCWLLTTCLLCAMPRPTFAGGQETNARPQLGMNLNGPADWNTELPFVDVFRLSRAWISQRDGSAWGQGPKLALDAHGWVTKLAPQCWAETPLCTIQGGHYPGGKYTVLYDGVGTLDASGAASVVSRAPGRLTLQVTSAKGGFFLQLKATDPKNYVRNIRVLMPGFEQSYRANPWHPAFLKRWQGVACLRFMDWMLTNGATVRHWSERPTPEDATSTIKGVPLEAMIDLSNRLKADAWFCMPHLADDDYIRRFAQMVKARLDPNRKVYIEYSNELWNGMFEQSRWSGQQGQQLKFAEKPWEAGWKFTAYRSVQIFRIWEEVFGGRGRLVRVLASQSANSYISEQIVTFQDAWKHADALAIAPYVTCNVGPEGTPPLKEAESWTVDQAMDYMVQKALPEVTKWMTDQQQVAKKYQLKLIAYEGGQHMVGVGGGENSDRLTSLLHAANTHPRMATVYQKYFDAWTKAGGGLFCYFASVGEWSKWGSWGILQYYDDDPIKSPKFQAVLHWARQNGQPMTLK